MRLPIGTKVRVTKLDDRRPDGSSEWGLNGPIWAELGVLCGKPVVFGCRVLHNPSQRHAFDPMIFPRYVDLAHDFGFTNIEGMVEQALATGLIEWPEEAE